MRFAFQVPGCSRRMTAAFAIVLAVSLFPCGTGLGQVGSNDVGWGVDPMEISRVGSSGWQFLKLPTDARSTALGGMHSATGYGNANSALSNPASTADVRGTDVQFSTMKWVADIRYSSLSAVHNLGSWGIVGAHAIYVNYGDMIRTEVTQAFDASGNDLGIIPVTEGLGTFTAHDLAAGISYARQITDHLQVGGTLRYLEQQIDDATMRTWALDIGTLYWTGIGSLRLSMLGRNFGPDGEFLSYEGRIAQAPAMVKLPMIFILGAAYDVLESSPESGHRLTVAAEYVKPNDGPDKWNVGVEYFAFSSVYFRGGYRFNYDEETYTFGLGVQYSLDDDFTLKLDYAYADLGRLSYVNMLTFGFGL